MSPTGTSTTTKPAGERFAKPVEIVEMHGLVPKEFALPNGTRHVCIAIGNGRAVLKFRESFLGNQLLPFLSYSHAGPLQLRRGGYKTKSPTARR